MKEEMKRRDFFKKVGIAALLGGAGVLYKGNTVEARAPKYYEEICLNQLLSSPEEYEDKPILIYDTPTNALYQPSQRELIITRTIDTANMIFSNSGSPCRGEPLLVYDLITSGPYLNRTGTEITTPIGLAAVLKDYDEQRNIFYFRLDQVILDQHGLYNAGN